MTAEERSRLEKLEKLLWEARQTLTLCKGTIFDADSIQLKLISESLDNLTTLGVEIRDMASELARHHEDFRQIDRNLEDWDDDKRVNPDYGPWIAERTLKRIRSIVQ